MIVTWLPSSQNDLRSIREYIGKDNPAAAKKVASAIVAIGETLTDMPQRGRSGKVPGTYELVVTKLPYTIAYRITVDQVQILRVLHYARLWPDML